MREIETHIRMRKRKIDKDEKKEICGRNNCRRRGI
jgi:hypothetical protein